MYIHVQSPRQEEKALAPSTPGKDFVFPNLTLKRVHAANKLNSCINL